MTGETSIPNTGVAGPAELAYGGPELLPEVMFVMENSFSEVYGESWNENQCRSMLSMHGTRLLVARIDGRISGFAISRIILEEEELLMIAVDPRHRSQNIGRQMMKQIITKTGESFGTAIFLEVRSNNPAQNLYREFGFEKIGIRKGYYTGDNKEKFDAITYKKHIV